MVTIDISQGAAILESLERAQVRVNVALWMFLSEFEDWRLVVSARQLDTADPREAYRLLHDALSRGALSGESLSRAGTMTNLPAIMVLPTSDPFIRALRRIFGKTRSVEGMRLGGQMIGDRFVQDAYVYRIA